MAVVRGLPEAIPMERSLSSHCRSLGRCQIADVRFMEVDSETKRAPDGSNFAEIYPLGLVPLVPERERAVILQYLQVDCRLLQLRRCCTCKPATAVRRCPSLAPHQILGTRCVLLNQCRILIKGGLPMGPVLSAGRFAREPDRAL